MQISEIQDWWNTRTEPEMLEIYRGQCEHNYIVQQTESKLFCIKCQHEISVDTDTYVFNYLHTIRDTMNEV